MRLNAKAFFYMLLTQAFALSLVFLGFLLDPLLGLWTVMLYFFCSSYFLYSYFCVRCKVTRHLSAASNQDMEVPTY